MTKKQSVQKAFKKLGDIDKQHDKGKITQKQHNTKSKKVLEKLIGVK